MSLGIRNFIGVSPDILAYDLKATRGELAMIVRCFLFLYAVKEIWVCVKEVIMFKIGDYVAHYKEGVCEVTDIGRLDMSCSDRRKEYYTLKPLYNAKGTLYTPVENEKRQIREVISGEEAKELLGEMDKIETIGVTDEKRRELFYREALLKNQCREWVALIKTSYMRKMNRIASGKKTINVDEKYLSIAEKFLFGELAVALDMTRDEVRRYMAKCLEERQ